MGMSMRWRTWGVVMAALVVAAAGASEPPASTTPVSSTGCVTTLTACMGPLRNSSETPQPTCCIPLKTAVETQKECLCGILNNPALLATYGVTTDQIFSLTARCNVPNATPSLCTGVPTSSSLATPPPPGKNSGSTHDVITWSGIALILAVMGASMF